MNRFLLTIACCLVVPWAVQKPAADGGEKVSGNSIEHEIRNVEGWTVHVDRRLVSGDAVDVGMAAQRLLADRLFVLSRRLPEKRIEQLRTIRIYLDHEHELTSMQYHPGAAWLRDRGYDPAMEKAVHIPRAQRLIDHLTQHAQPAVVEHELAHAYHDQFLGWNHAEIKRVYQDVVDGGRLESVRHIGGGLKRHYALTNEREFFAEMTETFLGTNDFYPFVRGELRDEFPEVHALLQAIWLHDTVPGVASESGSR